MKKKYREFLTENDLINFIKSIQISIEKSFDFKLTIDEVINKAVGSSTYRAFRANGTIKPSVVFKQWAAGWFNSETNINSILVESQVKFDEFIDMLCNDLLNKWNKELSGMTIFRSRKMVALLLKKLCYWDKLKKNELEIFIRRIPIPLDSKTLSSIRIIYNKNGLFKIPISPTMGFIDNEEKYSNIQDYYHKLAEMANVPLIYFDYIDSEILGG